jgi:hypothetical protein
MGSLQLDPSHIEFFDRLEAGPNASVVSFLLEEAEKQEKCGLFPNVFCMVFLLKCEQCS